jgi:predicted aspartyl protease
VIRCGVVTLGVCLLAAVAASAAQPPPESSSQSQQPSVPTSPEDLLFASPTRLDHIGRVVAPVMVDGQGPFRFMIDTGANYSAVSPRLAAALGLTASPDASIQVNGITGTANVPSVPIRELKAGALVLEHARLPVLWAPLMAGTDGILGIAGLKHDRLFVDFRANRVSIARSRGAIAPAGFISVRGKCLSGGLLGVEGRIGGVRMLAIIDTGSERTIGNMALYDALYSRARDPDLRRIATVYGATAEVGSGEVKLAPTIDLSSLRLTNVTVVYGGFHIFDVWNLADRPAMIVGMDVLGTVDSIGIDFRRCGIYVESRYDSGVNRFY